MSQPIEQLGMYLHLARASRLRQRPQVTDRLLVLCGSMCVDLRLPRIAEICREQILSHNPHHLIGQYASFDEAVYEVDFDAMLKQLYRRYPLEKVERMLDTLGIVVAGERNSYYSDAEYAAAILGCSLDESAGPDDHESS